MVSVILVAAGLGKRFGPGADKLFLEVAGRPVVGHTWINCDALVDVDEVVVVVRPGMESEFREVAAELPLAKPWRLAPGGEERQDSVWNGLQATAPGCEIVLVQDGARPCTDRGAMAATIAAAREMGAAVVGHRVTDTLKESADGRSITRTLDRSRVWAVQTPQTFQRSILLRALGEVRARGLRVTDDTAACEQIGQAVRLVETRLPNPKVTYPEDVPYLEWLMLRR